MSILSGRLDDEFKVLDLMHFKVALGDVNLQTCILQLAENELDMFSVLFECLTVDKDIIHVGSATDVKDVRTKNVIDVVLECTWCIGKTKRHYKVFIEI